jgi:hypothetical protein
VALADQPDGRMEKNGDQAPPLPEYLQLGIEVKSGAFFKLTLAEGETKVLITAGELHQGMNGVTIPTEGLFAGSATFQYCLDLKTAAVEEQVHIFLEVEIKSLAAGGNEETDIDSGTVRTRFYEISLLIGNQLLHSIRKKDASFAKWISGDQKEPAPVVHDPLYPVPGTRYPAATISPLNLALMAIRGIRNRAKKRQKEKIHQVYVNQMTGVFLRKMVDGEKKPLNLTIKINCQQGQLIKKISEDTPPSSLHPQH